MRCGKLHMLLLVAVLLIAGIVPSRAQWNYFVYVESENREPFYLRVQNKIHAAPNGHLVLSKLPEGELKVELGFPQSTAPEQQFSIAIGKSDRGFLLRNFSDKGWVLYDLQLSQLITAAPRQTQALAKPEETNTEPVVNDPFANMLSVVTQDSTVKQVTVQKDPPPADTLRQLAPKPAVTGNAIAGNNKPVSNTTSKVGAPITEVAVQQPVVQPQPEPVQVLVTEPMAEPSWVAPKKSVVTLINRFESSAGYDLVFGVTDHAGSVDTIKLFVEGGALTPPELVVRPDSSEQQQLLLSDTMQAVVMPAKDSLQTIVADTLQAAPVPPADTLRTPAAVVPEPKPAVKPELISVEAEAQKKEQPVQQPVAQQPVAPQPVATTVPNSNCRQQATEDDFVKLRRRMAQQKRDEDMVLEARKQFQQRCFTVAQLRVLGSLLMTDEWRYRLYDAALPFVIDFSNFPPLEATIESEYYRKRFQALLPNN